MYFLLILERLLRSVVCKNEGMLAVSVIFCFKKVVISIAMDVLVYCGYICD